MSVSVVMDAGNIRESGPGEERLEAAGTAVVDGIPAKEANVLFEPKSNDAALGMNDS